MIRRTPPQTPRDLSPIKPTTSTDSSNKTPPTPSTAHHDNKKPLGQFLAELSPGLQTGTGPTLKPSRLVNTNLTPHAEGKLWLHKAREALNSSRNLKTEITIEKSLQKLYDLAVSASSLPPSQQSEPLTPPPAPFPQPIPDIMAFTTAANDLKDKIEAHTKLLNENKNNISQISNKITSLNKPRNDTPTNPRNTVPSMQRWQPPPPPLPN
ncbi:unnamed protein product [Pieris macdunnoughi]|uniref:Uncharacterized protein n=1 Tax=Pieris macdunnoughi TaxID=345717 RepID=A0A821Y1D3_9NEOP|nr:unnamed protein product [Pieris macdunnoughi]